MKALRDSPLARPWFLMDSVPGSMRASRVRARRGAPAGRGGRSTGLGVWSAGVPHSGVLPHGRVRGITGSWRSILCLCLCLLHDPAEPVTSPLAVPPMSPPGSKHRRPQRNDNHEANAGLQHPLSTLQERRRRRPSKTRVRLAGCAFAGRGSNPLDRFERFQVTSPSPFPGLSLSQLGFVLWTVALSVAA